MGLTFSVHALMRTRDEAGGWDTQPGSLSAKLAKYRFPTTVKAAWEVLETLQDQSRIVKLYQHYFPEELAASERSLQKFPESSGYSSLELEFFGLVEEKMFPLDLGVYDFGSRINHIQCQIVTVDPAGDDDGLENYRVGWIIMFVLVGALGSEVFDFYDDDNQDTEEGLHPAIIEFLQNEVNIEGQPNWDTLRGICSKYAELPLATGPDYPLSIMPLVVDIAFHNTGNFWWDYQYEYQPSRLFPWSVESIDYLAKESREYEALADLAVKFLDYIENPGEDGEYSNIKKVVELWNSSIPTEPKADQPLWQNLNILEELHQTRLRVRV